MSAPDEDDWFKRLWFPKPSETPKRRNFISTRFPITPVGKWQKVFAKARRVQPSERGSSASAVRSHVRYLSHKDGHEHEDTLVDEIGELDMVRDWDDGEQHYRVIVAPERGDVLDMHKLTKSVCKDVSARFGKFRYAGAIHQKQQSNGRLNKHIHLIFKGPFDVGANSLKLCFHQAAAREATLQFEEKGLRYIPDPLDLSYMLEAKRIEHELSGGDYDR